MSAKLQKQNNVQYRYYELPPNLPVLALLGKRWIRPYGSDMPNSHFHNLMEIGYCYDGIGTMVYDEQRVPYGKGLISIIPPNFLHNTISKPGTTSRWEYLFFDAESFLTDMYGPLSQDAIELLRRSYNRSHHLWMDDHKELGQIILLIFELCRRKDKFYELEVKCLLMALIVRIVRLTPEDIKTRKAPAENNTLIQKALHFVQSNYDRHIQIADIAHACHVSETHCRRLFAKSIHMSPNAYINLVRVTAACKMLRNSHEPIHTIAAKCGFSSLSTFNRNFFEHVGTSPHQWRKGILDHEKQLEKKSILLFNGWL